SDCGSGIDHSLAPWRQGSHGRASRSKAPLVPDVLFIPFRLVLAKQRAEFVLEGLLAVVLWLALDVVSDGGQTRCAHREGGIAGLPGESSVELAGLVHPGGGGELDLLHRGGNGNGSTQFEEEMNMVVHAADQEG